MSTALRRLDKAIILPCTAGTGGTTAGTGVKFSADMVVVKCDGGDNNEDLFIGVSMETVLVGEVVNVAVSGIVGVLVGAGDATRGTKAIVLGSATGFTDATAHDSSGASDDEVAGIFMQSGVVADFVGMLVLPVSRGSA